MTPIKKEHDLYYLDICKTVAKRSKCLSRHIGAVIVKDDSIISTGFNGPARGIPHCSHRLFFDEDLLKRFSTLLDKIYTEETILDTCPRYLLGAKSGTMTDICPAAHAERNAIVQAAKNGVSTKDAKMYMDCNIPCFECLKEIINSGIREVICTSLDVYDNMTKYTLQNAKELIIRTYDGQYYKRWK